ncbi:MAG: cysteine hydrolase [Clostridia bacterium]|jgi:nicotinamidase-related amidase|nr:cysteine hydrolase [Clostridia bacterium]
MKIKNKKALRIFLSIFGVILIVTAIYVIRVLSLTTATKGDAIREYSDPKSALLVIDMQNDTTRNNSFYGDTTDFIDKVNKAINIAKEKSMEIIYIKQEYKNNPLDLLISSGKYRAGTEGVQLDSRLQVANENIFTKVKSDAFSSKNLENYLVSKQIDTIYIVGADATACVYKTALGGITRKYKVFVVEDSIISLNNEIIKEMLKKYSSDGIDITNLKQFDK